MNRALKHMGCVNDSTMVLPEIDGGTDLQININIVNIY